MLKQNQTQTKPLDLNYYGNLMQQADEISNQIQTTTQSYIEELKNFVEEFESLKQAKETLSQKYSDVLTKLMTNSMLLASKTTLNQLIEDDFTDKLKEVIDLMPAFSLSVGVSKLIKGYTLAKANGMNTRNMSSFDLIMMADNPDLATNVPAELKQQTDFIAKLLGELYQAKLGDLKYVFDLVKNKLALKEMEANALKEMYRNILNTLETKVGIKVKQDQVALQQQELGLKAQQLALERARIGIMARSQSVDDTLKFLQLLTGLKKVVDSGDLKSIWPNLLQLSSKDPLLNQAIKSVETIQDPEKQKQVLSDYLDKLILETTKNLAKTLNIKLPEQNSKNSEEPKTGLLYKSNKK